MFRLPSPDFLKEWLKICSDFQFPDLREFALGILRNPAAVSNVFIPGAMVRLRDIPVV
jgi:hypothetical protein